MFIFEWDEAKREANLASHGLDFLIVGELFDGRAMLTEDSPRGEEMRHRSVCEWRGLIVTVIWPLRDEGRRVISLRRARNVESQAYRSLFGE